MSKYITHRMMLLSLAYCDFWKMVAEKIGITEANVLAKLVPRYKEKKAGKDRCDRFMHWANYRTVNEDSHYDRLRVLEEYIRMIYPRLCREVQKEEELERWNSEAHNPPDGIRSKSLNIKHCGHPNVDVSKFKSFSSLSVRFVKHRKKKQDDPDQLTFDFGDEQ